MVAGERLRRLWASASLARSRALVRRPSLRFLVVAIGAAYAFVALLVGQMLVFDRYSGGYFVHVLWGNGASAWWNYPAIVAVEPWGVVGLPFLATVAMVIVAYGIGLGMAVVAVLTVRTLRTRRERRPAPATAASLLGLSPALVGLITLGACCSTTAAALAAIRLTSTLGASAPEALLANSWVLVVFQLGVLWFALLAQEELLAVNDLLGTEPTAVTAPVSGAGPWAGALGRLLLGLAAVALLLTPVVDWATVDPLTAGASDWLGWLWLDGLVGVSLLVAALRPRELLAALSGGLRSPAERAVRGLLAGGGLLLLGWVPAGVASTGMHGWGNELLAAAGLSPSTGAIASGLPAGIALALRWSLLFLLPGLVALAIALRPAALLLPFGRSAGLLRPVAPGPA